MLMNDAEFRLLISLGAFALFLLFVLLSLYLVIKLFRFAIRWLRWGADQSGNDAVLALVSFAIAAFFYPTPITYLVQAGWDFLSSLLTYLPQQLQQQLIFLQG